MTKDISESGLALKSPVSLPKDCLIKIGVNVFYKGKARDISAIGVVRHSLVTTGGFIIGVQIKNCTTSSSNFIAKFSNRLI